MKTLRFIFGWFFVVAGFLAGAYIGLWQMLWWGSLTFFQAVSGDIELGFWQFLWTALRVGFGFPVCVWFIRLGASFETTILKERIGLF